MKRYIPPRLASVLGFGGLIPFICFSKPVQERVDWNKHLLNPISKKIGRRTLNATEVQVTYGCMILTFLGGPHWGFVMAASSSRTAKLGFVSSLRLLWGVTPSLVAWPCASMPAPHSLDILSYGLTTALVVDTVCWLTKLVPSYYLTLRIPLTLVAVASLQSNK